LEIIMTVSSTTTKNSYSGNGSTTTFAYGFKIFANTDLTVILRAATGVETVQTLTTHYTVSNVGVDGGGNVVFVTAPASGVTVVIRRNMALTQSTDYVANDPFPAATHEDALDRLTFISQQIQEEVNRSIKLSRTNTMTSTEFTTSAADRANKILAFDTSGELAVTQELGTYKGTDTTTTTAAYTVRDIIKSTTAGQLNNVYICIAISVIGDTLTDTDHFELLVDAYSAASSAAAAASSATDAQTAQTAAELAETNAETAETNAETAETNAAASEANAAASEANAATSESNASTSESNASTSESNASTSASTATTQAGIATTQAGNASTSASNAATSESNAATSESNAATSESNAATSESNAATSESNASTSETNAAASAAAAAASADTFDDTYLGSKSSDPSVDNDGDALNAGDLYFNTTSNTLKVYTGSAWQDAAIDSSGFVQTTGDTMTGALVLNSNLSVDGTTNLDVVDIDGAVDMASTVLVTGVLTTTAATVFNGGFASNAASTLTVTEGNHVNGLKLINSQPGGYGSALTFQSERSDNNAIVSAAQIRTQGQDSWNSEASADSNLFFATSLNGSLTDKMVIKDDGNVGIGTSSPDYLVEVEKANGDHTGTAIAITNSQDGGYGSVLNFVSKRDDAGNVIASQIGTQGDSSWNSDASTSSNLLFSTVNANTLAERMRINSLGEVLIGTTTQGRETNLAVVGTDQLPTGAWSQFGIYSNDSYAINKGGSMMFGGQDGSVVRSFFASIKGAKENSTSGNYAGYLAFYTRPSDDTPREYMRITSAGRLLIGLSTGNGDDEALQVYRNGAPTLSVARQQDGTIVNFRVGSVDGAAHGSISISGVTCSYNAFSGSHWSRLSDNSKPTILKGTIIETIDEMCDWYRAEFTVEATTKEDTDSESETFGQQIEDVAEHIA
jgi:hypothetical protein